MRGRELVATIVACCTLWGGNAVAEPPQTPPDPLVQRLEAIPGMTVVRERPTEEGFRFLDLAYSQPADHRRPDGPRFDQRLTLLHRGFDRPTVAYTTGYYVPEDPYRAEPTRLLDANQVSIEYRFFKPSRPRPADWHELDIWQGATDEHRVINAVREVYSGAWITTGQSKGGMSAVYHRRFYPRDVDGTVAYVAPNDVDNDEDRAYDEFFTEVGTPQCRHALSDLQREILLRRDDMLTRYADFARSNGLTFRRLPGGMDQALEATVLDTAFTFWQYRGQSDCPDVPPADAPSQRLWDFVEHTVGFEAYADQGLEYYQPYYYQAATELGWPTTSHGYLDDLLRHDNDQGPSMYLPDDLPVRFREHAMRDIDTWVRTRGSQLMFVNGSDDPWSAEPFRLGPGTRDASVHVVPGGNHGAEVEQLPPAERDLATSTVRRWADLDGTGRGTYIPALDDPPLFRHPA